MFRPKNDYQESYREVMGQDISSSISGIIDIIAELVVQMRDAKIPVSGAYSSMSEDRGNLRLELGGLMDMQTLSEDQKKLVDAAMFFLDILEDREHFRAGLKLCSDCMFCKTVFGGDKCIIPVNLATGDIAPIEHFRFDEAIIRERYRLPAEIEDYCGPLGFHFRRKANA